MSKVKQQIVSITKKGQATVPKEMRKKYGIEKKALAVEMPEGILIKRLPSVGEEMGSLKKLFRKKTARELLSEARIMDVKREKKLEGLA